MGLRIFDEPVAYQNGFGSVYGFYRGQLNAD